jgi:hypothetical protein
MQPEEANMESAKEWAARIKAQIEAEQAAKTPEERAADQAKFREWLASLPILPAGPLRPGEVRVAFIKRRPVRGGSPPPPPDSERS